MFSLIEFAEKYGADISRLEEGIEDAHAMRKESDDLYLEGDYAGSLESIREGIAKLEGLQVLAVKFKERALFWVYVIEWLVVSSAAMVSGFVLWSLMIKRSMYREVEITSIP